MAGVSVRTLHYYDQTGLLKPSVRTEAGYRLYGEKELLRLQQILFYKELDFPLQEIHDILDDPDFDLIMALKKHKQAIKDRRNRLGVLMTTIDKTILTLKGERHMLTNDELYAGFPKEKAEAYRKEAIDKYGAETIEKSEAKLRKMSKEDIAALKKESEDIIYAINGLITLDPTDVQVQKQVARHYENTLKWWGGAVPDDKIAEAYTGLANLYVEDDRFYASEGADFKRFLNQAMLHFVESTLK